jgi:hypothetical protein
MAAATAALLRAHGATELGQEVAELRRALDAEFEKAALREAELELHRDLTQQLAEVLRRAGISLRRHSVPSDDDDDAHGSPLGAQIGSSFTMQRHGTGSLSRIADSFAVAGVSEPASIVDAACHGLSVLVARVIRSEEQVTTLKAAARVEVTLDRLPQTTRRDFSQQADVANGQDVRPTEAARAHTPKRLQLPPHSTSSPPAAAAATTATAPPVLLASPASPSSTPAPPSPLVGRRSRRPSPPPNLIDQAASPARRRESKSKVADRALPRMRLGAFTASTAVPLLETYPPVVEHTISTIATRTPQRSRTPSDSELPVPHPLTRVVGPAASESRPRPRLPGERLTDAPLSRPADDAPHQPDDAPHQPDATHLMMPLTARRMSATVPVGGPRQTAAGPAESLVERTITASSIVSSPSSSDTDYDDDAHVITALSRLGNAQRTKGAVRVHGKHVGSASTTGVASDANGIVPTPRRTTPCRDVVSPTRIRLQSGNASHHQSASARRISPRPTQRHLSPGHPAAAPGSSAHASNHDQVRHCVGSMTSVERKWLEPDDARRTVASPSVSRRLELSQALGANAQRHQPMSSSASSHSPITPTSPSLDRGSRVGSLAGPKHVDSVHLATQLSQSLTGPQRTDVAAALRNLLDALGSDSTDGRGAAATSSSTGLPGRTNRRASPLPVASLRPSPQRPRSPPATPPLRKASPTTLLRRSSPARLLDAPKPAWK